MFASNTSQVSNDVKYIEDFCSVYLRTGTGSSQTVTTGVKENTGALVISKSRTAATDWAWYDTFRGATKELASNTTAAEITQSQGLTSFNTDGHTWGTLAKVNTSGATYVDFVLKPTPKFFDVVTYTGNGALATRYISHSLGSVPGTIIVKRTDTTSDWIVIHRGTTFPLILNSTAAATSTNRNNGYPDLTYTDATQFAVSDGASGVSAVNASGGTYVAYLFAHNAGGFGLTGTDNVISCGSYTGNGSTSGPVTTLGYEPQWILIKNASATTGGWVIVDNMRGLPVGAASNVLRANVSGAESTSVGGLTVTATGFQQHDTDPNFNESGATYIYIAIRRGPMKTPTSGTSVFLPLVETNIPTSTVGFPVDMAVEKHTVGAATYSESRLTQGYLQMSNTNAETASGSSFASNTQFTTAILGTSRASKLFFRRAPGFFDEVCWSGNEVAARAVPHNLGVVPQLMIVKCRNAAIDWPVYAQALGVTKRLLLNSTSDSVTDSLWGNTTPTASVFYLGTNPDVNGNGKTYVAYLFASCPGVSKCGSYTGTGTTQQINCGFTAGARFVLIKRTDSAGDWYVWDSARGIVAGNDPYLLLNSTAAEVTTTDYVDTFSSGFEISSTAPAAINANGGTFIYLAIA